MKHVAEEIAAACGAAANPTLHYLGAAMADDSLLWDAGVVEDADVEAAFDHLSI